MEAAVEPKASNQETIYTYIAIPIDALKQSSVQGVQSLKVAQNVILKELPDGNIAQQIQPNKSSENIVIRALTKNDSGRSILNKSINNPKNSSNLFVKVPGQISSFMQNSNRPTVIESNKTQSSEYTRKSVISKPEKNQNDSKKSEVRYLKPKSSQVVFKTKTVKDEGKYKCSLCGDILDKMKLYRKHMEAHRNSKKFKCDQCSACYNVEDNLKLHMAMHNRGDPTCPICTKKFQRLASLKSHIINHQVDETFTCIECLAEFDTEDYYNKHMESHNKEKLEEPEDLSFQCSVCSQVFRNRVKYKEHVSFHIKVKKMMKGKTKRRVAHNKEYPHKCHICEKPFSKYCLLERHLRIHNGDRPFVCHLCDRAFTQKGTLQIHMARHAGLKPFACTLCPAKFCQKGNLRVHVQKTHTIPKSGEKVYKCTMCMCIFKRVSTLNTHITRVHAGDKADDISDLMEQLKKLEKHLDPKGIELQADISQIDIPLNSATVISKEKSDNDPVVKFVKLVDSSIEGTVRCYVVKQRKAGEHQWYICSYCSKEFKKPSDLIRHMRVHTREKPFKCKQCNQAFALKSTLNTHATTHLAKKQFDCILCSKSFTSIRSLNTHLRKHDKNVTTDIQSYKCNVCSKVCRSLARMKAHTEIHNKESNQQNNLKIVMQEPMMETSTGLFPVAAPRHKLQYSETEALKRRHKCHLCTGAFTKRVHLRRHLLTHTGEKKHKCEACPKAFYSPYSLKQHAKIHNEKNFSCKTCGKRFVNNAILQRHIVIHSAFRPYVCPYCKKRFKTVLLCRNHINIHKKDIDIQMTALCETGECSDMAETVDDINVENKNQVVNQTYNNISNIPQLIKQINVNNSKSNTEKKNLQKDNGNSIPTTVDGSVQQTTDGLQQADQIILQASNNLTDYSDHPSLISDNSNDSDFINIDDTIATLVQENLSDDNEPEYPALYINYDELQTFNNGNLYNTCLPPLKTGDPLLLGGMGDIHDPNILFTTDPSLNQINDIQLDAQTLEAFIPLATGTNLGVNNLPFLTDPSGNIMLPSIPEESVNMNTQITLPSISEITKKTRISSEHFSGIVLPEDRRLNENYVIKLGIGLNEQPDVVDVNQINQEGIILPNLFYSTVQLDTESTVLPQAKINFGTLESSNTTEFLNPQTNTVEGYNFTCMICKKGLNTPKDFKLHDCIPTMKTVKPNTGESTNSNSLLKKKSKDGQNQNDASKQIANVNKKSTATTSDKIPKFKCEVCGKMFVRKNSLYRHRQVFHKKKEKEPIDNTCRYCAKNFKKPSDLERHTRTHTGEKPFSCDKCEKKFSLKSTLDTHYRTHNPSGNKDFSCPVCGSYFSCRSSLRVHMLAHSGVKPYQCSMCPERFRTSGHRKCHMLLHFDTSDGSKQFKKTNNILESMTLDPQMAMPLTNVQLPDIHDNNQGILQTQEKDILSSSQSVQMDPLLLQFNNELLQDCGENELPSFIQIDINNDGQITNVKSVPNSDNINSFGNQLYEPSMVTQDKSQIPQLNGWCKEIVRNFECDVCHKKYSTKSVLTKHKKRHNVQLFNCTNCGNGFPSQLELNNHEKVHLGYRPFTCDYCTNTFTLEKHLKIHMKRMHDTYIN